MDSILIILKKKWPKGFICPYTGTIFYNIRIYSRSQVSVYRTIGPLVYIFAQNIDSGYTFEPPQPVSYNEYPQSVFWIKKKK